MPKEPKKPNLLFIFTDEQRADTMACYGNTFVKTPNLNALAQRSFVFENAYVSQPVCTPSRSTIMTGQWPHSNGCTSNNIPLREETRTLAEMVPDDYTCGYYGKWHLGDELFAQHGFRQWVSIEDMYRAHYSRKESLGEVSDYHHYLVSQGFQPDVESHGARVFARTTAANLPVEHTKASFLGREAAKFIRDNAADPFVLFVNFLEPHMPFTGPLNDMYPPADIPVGPHFRLKPENASELHRLMAEYYMSKENFSGGDLRSEAGCRALRARYLGLVTLVDMAVGNILRALDESGQADNTIVVFTSEHGDMMGDHGIVAKCVMYEEAIKVPCLVRIPWLNDEQRRVPGRFSQIDMVPTLLDLMGQPLPAHLQGQSRKAVLEGTDSLAGNDVFFEWNGSDGIAAAGVKQTDSEGNRPGGAPWRNMISADGWKLNLSPVDRGELYDLNTDPHELNNVFDDPANGRRIAEMTARIRAWQEQTRDTCPLPNP